MVGHSSYDCCRWRNDLLLGSVVLFWLHYVYVNFVKNHCYEDYDRHQLPHCCNGSQCEFHLGATFWAESTYARRRGSTRLSLQT